MKGFHTKCDRPFRVCINTMKIHCKLFVALSMMACTGVASAYDFVVSNATSVKITGVQASEDGKTWGAFDVGAGIPAHSKTKLIWSSETDESNCEWQVMATYADGSESEPETFDFCEEDLEIEFSE